jgi:hypothetical protein
MLVDFSVMKIIENNSILVNLKKKKIYIKIINTVNKKKIINKIHPKFIYNYNSTFIYFHHNIKYYTI